MLATVTTTHRATRGTAGLMPSARASDNAIGVPITAAASLVSTIAARPVITMKDRSDRPSVLPEPAIRLEIAWGRPESYSAEAIEKTPNR